MRLKYLFPIGCACLLAGAVLYGQAIGEDEIHVRSGLYVPDTSTAVRVKTNVVEVPVIVKDKQGNPFGGLQKNDFELYDDGKKQAVSFFSVENSAHKELAPAPGPGPGGMVAAPTVAAAAVKPRYVALYFDDNNMPPGDFVQAQDAAEKFVRDGLEPGDRIGIFTSSKAGSLTFTEDKQKVLDILAKLRPHEMTSESGICSHIAPYQAYLISKEIDGASQAFDLAMAECATVCSNPASPSVSQPGTRSRRQAMPAADPVAICVRQSALATLALTEDHARDTLDIISDVIEFLGGMPGRRVLVLTSSGFLTQTLGPQQDKVVDAAVRANVVINSLDAKGLYADLPGPPLNDARPVIVSSSLANYRDDLRSMQKQVFNDPLALLAEGTGGRFYQNNNDLGRGFRELASAPDVSYVLGFSPDNMKADNKRHDLKVTLTNSRGLTIEARRAYFTPSPETKEQRIAAERTERMEREAAFSDRITEIPMEIRAQPDAPVGGVSLLKIAVRLDVRGLPFQRINDRSVERLIFIAALYDGQGRYVTGREQVVDLSVKAATLAQLNANGIQTTLTLQPPAAGSYRLRNIVEEVGSGRLAATSQFVEIH